MLKFLKNKSMRKPYLNFYKEVNGFKVWIVDGKYVRDEIDEEFTNFGQHYLFNFIPEDEFWIDREDEEGEIDYYIDHLIVENRLMKRGVDAHNAYEKADRVEKRERSKNLILKRGLDIKTDKKEILRRVHKKLLKKYSGEVKIWVVDGELVRDFFFIDFTEGGHDKVYPFIPKNEVWIDDDVGPKEIKFILLHELHERNLMEKGWIYSLDEKREIITDRNKEAKIHKGAHEDAAEVEYHCRKHPKEIDEYLKKEIR